MKKTLIRGIFISLPVVITIYVLWSLFIKIDTILQPLIFNLLGVNIVGLGFVSVLLAMYLIGLVGGNTLGKWVLKQFNKVVDRVPLANKLYSGVSEVVGMIGDSEKSAFSKVVRVEFPMKGIYSIGFLTNDKSNAIMIPTTPNPTNGFLIYTDKYEVLDISVDEGLKTILSMGVLE